MAGAFDVGNLAFNPSHKLLKPVNSRRVIVETLHKHGAYKVFHAFEGPRLVTLPDRAGNDDEVGALIHEIALESDGQPRADERTVRPALARIDVEVLASVRNMEVRPLC